MTRASRFVIIGAICTLIYALLYLRIIPVPFLSKQVADELLPVIPWWLLVSFGSYSLGSLGMGLLTFRDCPDAHQELLMEISEAKNDLRLKGVEVD
ncbi:dolichol-phosphate mannosyltransferase subunit 3 [Calocera cornea HHB12733]|uniref:Dolichol-phosphate mannosyltransferase subunit 3 n=1 Tax=Calocera cornea HHB12733 TaxID=1353952 RepID=A0A165CR35_9BASI|nr:dolichol-phosphate mannosyltransferase subunit 3 [Calocera cornea HHB12733]